MHWCTTTPATPPGGFTHEHEDGMTTRADGGPRSGRILDELRRRITAGELAPGDRVPSTREIVRDHGVAMATATRVLTELRREGLVRAVPGVGTVVTGSRTPATRPPTPGRNAGPAPTGAEGPPGVGSGSEPATGAGAGSRGRTAPGAGIGAAGAGLGSGSGSETGTGPGSGSGSGGRVGVGVGTGAGTGIGIGTGSRPGAVPDSGPAEGASARADGPAGRVGPSSPTPTTAHASASTSAPASAAGIGRGSGSGTGTGSGAGAAAVPPAVAGDPAVAGGAGGRGHRRPGRFGAGPARRPRAGTGRRTTPPAAVRRDRGREGLGTACIVASAIAIADAEGLEAVSMRRVAAELSVATMSLYRHVSDKDALLVQMTDTVFATQPLPADPPPGWRPRLHLAAHALWALFRRHPWLASSVSLTRPQVIPGAIPYSEWVLAALVGHGMDDQSAFTAHLTLLNHIRAAASLLEAERQAQADTGQSEEEWTDSLRPAFGEFLGTGSYPNLARLQTNGYDFDVDALFAFGLDRFLDGLALLIAPHPET
ncbi:TetR/AcrR family transcriptional regulator C-terminal domain-containing protein (plasmid) [Streptomyces sp. BI20]|uniref:TetR/AcrR family transcriptional regulator C-terminal domain-containing protein n=1 Tax=Streptomyces sp. BI20 TaxID=3403460 RepID=UPI003C7185B0